MKLTLIIGLGLMLLINGAKAGTVANWFTTQNPAPAAQTAPAALTALGGASLTASNVLSGGQNVTGPLRVTAILANAGLSGTGIVFDEVTSGGDQTFDFTGNAISSGDGVTFDILGTNADTSLATNRYGHRILDQVSIVGVGNAAPYNDFPGALLVVAPQTEIDIGHNNNPQIVVAGAGPDLGRVAIPDIGGSTNIFVFAETLHNGTNTYVRTNDVPRLQMWDTVAGSGYINMRGGFVFANGTTVTGTNGLIIKSNGKLNNTVAIDPLDTATASFSDATVKATNFFTAGDTSTSAGTPSGYFDSSGAQGWHMSGANFGVCLRDGGNVLFCMGGSGTTFGDGGIFPTGGNGAGTANDNTWDLGTAGHTWKQIYTHGITTLATNVFLITATGWTNTLGSNAIVNIIGTAVTYTNFNSGGIAWSTNTTVTGGQQIYVQAGGFFKAASGLTGTGQPW